MNPWNEERMNEVLTLIESRLAKQPYPLAQEIRVAITHAEMNFWAQPYETFHGGTPLLLVYPKGDNSALPLPIECPEDVDGPDVIPLMAYLGGKHDAKFVVYSATSKSGCLLVMVLTFGELWKLRCPILQYRGKFSLADHWNIEWHEAKGDDQ